MQRLASRAFLIFALLMLAACARDDLTQQQAAAILSKTPLRAEQQTIQLRAEVGQFADPKVAADWAKRYILATDQAAASAIEQQAPSPVGAARETIVGNLARLREAGRQGLLSDVSFSENKRGEAVELVATGIIAKDLASSCRRQDGATYQPGDPVCVGGGRRSPFRRSYRNQGRYSKESGRDFLERRADCDRQTAGLRQEVRDTFGELRQRRKRMALHRAVDSGRRPAEPVCALPR